MASQYRIIKSVFWNQWVHPFCIQHNSKIYVGTANSVNGAQRIHEINPKSRTAVSQALRTPVQVDDHNPVCLLPPVDSGDVWRAIVAGHPDTLKLYATSDSNFGTFSDQGAILAGDYTYAMACRDGDNVSFFSRRSDPFEWLFFVSSDAGATWDSYEAFNFNDGSYFAAIDRGDGSFDIGSHFNPNGTGDQNIYAGRMTLDGVLSANASAAGYDCKNNDSVNIKDHLTEVFTAAGDERTRFFGMNRNGRITFCKFLRNSTGPYNPDPVYNAEYYYLDFDYSDGTFSAPVKVCDAGIPLERPTGANAYYGGIDVAEDGRMATASNVDGLWRLDIWDADGNLQATPVPPQVEKIGRPRWVPGLESGHLVWGEGMYRTYNSTKGFDMDLCYGRF